MTICLTKNISSSGWTETSMRRPVGKNTCNFFCFSLNFPLCKLTGQKHLQKWLFFIKSSFVLPGQTPAKIIVFRKLRFRCTVHLPFQFPRVNFINPFMLYAKLLHSAPNFWVAFLRRKSLAQSINGFMKSTPDIISMPTTDNVVCVWFSDT